MTIYIVGTAPPFSSAIMIRVVAKHSATKERIKRIFLGKGFIGVRFLEDIFLLFVLLLYRLL